MEKKQRKIFFILGLVLSVIYLFLSLAVHQDFFRSWDYDSVIWWQNVLTRKVDVPFSFITLLGSSEVITSILIFIFFYLLFIRKQFFYGIFFYFLIFVLEIFGKIFIYHPLPPSNFYRYALNFKMPSGGLLNTSFSYPSGHTARVTFLLIILFFLILLKSNMKLRYKIFFSTLNITLLAIVFISRIYLGEHWFSDVVGGVVLGGFLAMWSISLW